MLQASLPVTSLRPASFTTQRTLLLAVPVCALGLTMLVPLIILFG